MQKVVSNSGDLDGSFVFYYDKGWRLLEVRDGSANVVAQVYGGTQYIDEIVAMRAEDGYMVVNQDANWNVTSATDLAGRVLERTFYTAYGLPTFNSETYFGDYAERSEAERPATGKVGMDADVRAARCPQEASMMRATGGGDGDVDSTDDAELGSGQTCWGAGPSGACRVFDFDQDGDLDSADQTVMTALVGLASTNHVGYASPAGTLGNPVAYHGVLFEAEV